MSPRLRRAFLVAFVVALVVQLVGLYTPRPPSQLAPIFGWDKVVHAAIFGAPVLLGLLAGLAPAVLVTLMVVHVPVSEIVQGTCLPRRSGDWHDAVADLLGIALAVAVWLVAVRSGRDRARSGL